jgi:hypothetical protein
VAVCSLRAEKARREVAISSTPSVRWKRGAVRMDSTCGRDAVCTRMHTHNKHVLTSLQAIPLRVSVRHSQLWL